MAKTPASLAVVIIHPDLFSGVRVHKLGCYGQLLPIPPDAAVQQVTHAEIASDLHRLDVFALVSERRIPGDDEQFGELGQTCSEVTRDAVTEVFLSRVTTDGSKSPARSPSTPISC
jgi:hypothetical protein